MRITTNNHPRPIIEAYELTEEERKEFDYYDFNETGTLENNAQFFKYKNQLYDLGEFMAASPDMMLGTQGWDGYQSDTYFSGILVKYTSDHEHVIVGRYTT